MRSGLGILLLCDLFFKGDPRLLGLRDAQLDLCGLEAEAAGVGEVARGGGGLEGRYLEEEGGGEGGGGGVGRRRRRRRGRITNTVRRRRRRRRRAPTTSYLTFPPSSLPSHNLPPARLSPRLHQRPHPVLPRGLPAPLVTEGRLPLLRAAVGLQGGEGFWHERRGRRIWGGRGEGGIDGGGGRKR